jgi:hypothetical protein
LKITDWRRESKNRNLKSVGRFCAAQKQIKLAAAFCRILHRHKQIGFPGSYGLHFFLHDPGCSPFGQRAAEEAGRLAAAEAERQRALTVEEEAKRVAAEAQKAAEDARKSAEDAELP